MTFIESYQQNVLKSWNIMGLRIEPSRRASALQVLRYPNRQISSAKSVTLNGMAVLQFLGASFRCHHVITAIAVGLYL